MDKIKEVLSFGNKIIEKNKLVSSNSKILGEALTFDDVLIVPQKSDVNSRRDVETSTFVTKNLKIQIPIISSNMDTVTESEMAIALARQGGLGIIHRFLPIEEQVDEVKRVKRSEGILIEQPFALGPEQTLRDALEIMTSYKISGILITDINKKLLGILSTRDVLFETNLNKKIEELMTTNLITAPAGTNLETAKEILHQNKIEKLPLINEKGILQGLITAKDIIKKDQYPNSSKDSKGRLLVGAAIGVKDDVVERTSGLLDAGADCIVIDIAHGHSESVINTIKLLRKEFGNVQVIAGNVASKEGALDLMSAGADCIKAGVGGGSVCLTRIVTGSGVPQLHAVLECSEASQEMDIPIMADGGIRTSGDIVKAIGAGANSVMLGNIFAGTEESPGTVVMKEGKKFKIYRGSAGYGTALSRKQQRLGNLNISEYTAEGVESLVPYKGHVHEVVNQLIGGLRSGMSYSGARTIEELKRNVKFLKITGAGFKESSYHDVNLL